MGNSARQSSITLFCSGVNIGIFNWIKFDTIRSLLKIVFLLAKNLI